MMADFNRTPTVDEVADGPRWVEAEAPHPLAGGLVSWFLPTGGRQFVDVLRPADQPHIVVSPIDAAAARNL